MADIELVIKIPEEEYDLIVNDEACGLNVLTRAIAKGIPLPKRRGRLIILSEEAVKREQVPLGFSCQSWISDVGLSNATVAIIETDNGDGNTWYDILADEMSESQLRTAVKYLRKKLAEVMDEADSN